MASARDFVIIFLAIAIYFSPGQTSTPAKDKKKPRLNVVSIDECRLGNKRVDMVNEVKYSAQARKVSRLTTVIKASFNIPKKFGPITFSLVGYQLQQSNVRDLVVKMENMNCHSIIPLAVVNILTIKFDKNCNVLPNQYEVDNINLQDHVDIFAQTLVGNGKYAFDLEFWSPKGVVACASFTINFVTG